MSYSLTQQRKSKPKYNHNNLSYFDKISHFPFTNQSLIEQIYQTNTPRVESNRHKSPYPNKIKLSELSRKSSQNTNRQKKITLEDSLNEKLAQKCQLISSQERQLRCMMKKVQQLEKQHELRITIHNQKSAEQQKSLIKEINLLKEHLKQRQNQIKILTDENHQFLQKQRKGEWKFHDEIMQQNHKYVKLVKEYKLQIQQLNNKNDKYEEYIKKQQREHHQQTNLYENKVNQIKNDFDKMNERIQQYKWTNNILKQQNKQLNEQIQQLKTNNTRAIHINQQLNWQMSEILKVVEKDFRNFGKKCTTAETILQIQKEKLEFYEYTAKQNENIINLLKGKLQNQSNNVNQYNNSIVEIMKKQIEDMKVSLIEQLANQSLKHQSNNSIIQKLNQKQIQLQNIIKKLQQSNQNLQNQKKELSSAQKEEISQKFMIYLKEIDQLKTTNKALIYEVERLRDENQQYKKSFKVPTKTINTETNTEINNQELNNYEKYIAIQANLWLKINKLQSQMMGNMASNKNQRQRYDKIISNKNELIAFLQNQIVKIKEELQQKNQAIYKNSKEDKQNNKDNGGMQLKGFLKVKQQQNLKIRNECAIKTINLEAKNIQTFENIKKLQFQNRVLKIRLQEAQRNLSKELGKSSQNPKEAKQCHKQQQNEFKIRSVDTDKNLTTSKTEQEGKELVYIEWS